MNRGHASRLAPSLWPNDSAEPTPWSRSKEGNGHAPSPSDGRSAPAAGRLLRWLVTTPFSLREGQRISFLLGTRTRSASATASAIALMNRARFFGHVLDLGRSCRHSRRRRQVGLSRRPVTVALYEPLSVVELDERPHGLGELVDISPGPGPDALLLQGSDEPLGAAVTRRLADVGRGVADPEPGERAGEVRARVLRSPVMPTGDSACDVGGELPEAIPHRGVDRLERCEAVTAARHGGPGLGRVVVHRHESPDPPVSGRVGHGRIRAPQQVRSLRDDRAVVRPWPPTSPGSLRRKQACLPHEAQHALATHPDAVLAPQPRRHLAVALARERRTADRLADLHQEPIVGDRGAWTTLGGEPGPVLWTRS